jgi:hypothetical protein
LLRLDHLRMCIIITIIMMRRRRVLLELLQKSTLQRVELLRELAMTINTKITIAKNTRRVKNKLMMATKKVSVATEEVVVEATEETATESTIKMRRASKLLSKMKLIIITTIQRDHTAGDNAAEEAAREVARVEITTLTEVVVVATEVRVALGLPRSTKMLERSERPTPSTPLAKKLDLKEPIPPQLHSESKSLLSAE